MTWLYVPSTSSPFALASADSSLASELPNPERAQSCTWRGKPLQPQAWSRQWKRGGFIRLLSGLTLEPSILDRGAASFIASLRETRASPTASPDSAREPRTIAGLSTGCSNASRSSGLIVSSGKTCRGISPGNSPLSSRHWSEWAIALRAEYSARPKSVPAVDESASSLWPTATAENFDGGDPQKLIQRRERCAEKYGNNGFGLTLGNAAQMWPTPKTITGGPESAARKQELGRLASGGGDLQAAASDHKDGATTLENVPVNGLLGRQVLTFQSSLPDQAMDAGQKSSSDRRSLNPLFVEWLMGWPTGLSGFERSETAFVPWLQRMRGALSRR